MKVGIARVKKLKSEYKNNGFHKNGNNNKYSLDKPPQIFIRKAVSSDEDEEESPRPKKRYREVVKDREGKGGKQKDSPNRMKDKESPKRVGKEKDNKPLFSN